MRSASGVSQQGKDQCVIGERSAQETIFFLAKKEQEILSYVISSYQVANTSKYC